MCGCAVLWAVVHTVVWGSQYGHMELTLEGSKTFRNSKTFQNLGRNVPEGPKDSKMFPKKPIPMSTLPALNPSTPTLVSDLPVAPQASPMGAIDPAGLPDLVPLSATLAPKPIANPEGARRVRPRPDEAPMSQNELKAQNWTDDQKVRYMIHYDKKARLWREAQKWVATRIFHMDTGKLEATFLLAASICGQVYRRVHQREAQGLSLGDYRRRPKREGP